MKKAFCTGLAMVAIMVFAGVSFAGTYTVQSGDTLGAIAKTHGTSTSALQKMNAQKIKSINKIRAGWVIAIPDQQVSSGTPVTPPTPKAESYEEAPPLSEPPMPTPAVSDMNVDARNSVWATNVEKQESLGPRKPASEIELNTGVGGFIQDPGGKESSTGIYGWVDFMYWNPMGNGYDWGLGGYVDYHADVPGKNYGGFLAAQQGIEWESSQKSGPKSFQFKLREGLGLEHRSGKNKLFPGIGGHQEYYHHMAPDTPNTFWFIKGSELLKGDLSDITAVGKVGIEHRFTKDFSVAAYIGPDWSGRSSRLLPRAGIEGKYRLPNHMGKIYAGVGVRFPSPITALPYVEYELKEKVQHDHAQKRADSVRLVGRGVGDNSIAPDTVAPAKVKAESHRHHDGTTFTGGSSIDEKTSYPNTMGFPRPSGDA